MPVQPSTAYARHCSLSMNACLICLWIHRNGGVWIGVSSLIAQRRCSALEEEAMC